MPSKLHQVIGPAPTTQRLLLMKLTFSHICFLNKWIHHAIFVMAHDTCPLSIPFGGVTMHKSNASHSKVLSPRALRAVDIQTSDQPIRHANRFPLFIGIQNGFKCRTGGLIIFLSVALVTPGWNKITLSFVPSIFGHVVSNIQSSSFASSLMSLPYLHLWEFRRSVPGQKFLVPVLTWRGFSRALHDPPDVW